MSIDSQEIADFKAALKRTPTEAIIKKLDDGVIARSWKREIAEAEVARRQKDDNSRSLAGIFLNSQKHSTAILRGWIVTVLLIIGAIAAAFIFVIGRSSG